MKKRYWIIGTLTIAAGFAANHFLSGREASVPVALEEEPASAGGSEPTRSIPKGGAPVAEVASPASPQPSEVDRIADLNQVDRDFRVDLFNSWAKQLKNAKTPEESGRLVRQGLAGFKKLDANSKAMMRMNFCMALLNRDEPEAIRFVEATAKLHSSNSSVLSNLLAGLDSERAVSRYPVLTGVASQWLMGHKEMRYEPSMVGISSKDPAVLQAIEGSKFLNFDIDQIQRHLTRIKAI